MKYTSLLILTFLAVSCQTNTPEITGFLTLFNETSKLEKLAFDQTESDSFSGEIIDLDNTLTDQEFEGFGFALTQGSAEAIMQLDEAERHKLLNELFSSEAGLGFSVIRISIGASDLSNSNYTYADSTNDSDFQYFRAAEPDERFLFPVLAEILRINPQIKIMATPWTAPIWMKSNQTWIGGSLLPEYYGAYATYLERFLDFMKQKGISIWAISIQNEPENPHNEPSMVMTATEQYHFIQDFLGPKLKGKYTTRILAYDHNCDHPEYPMEVLKSDYTDGAAFHLYAGDISAMGKVREKTGKDVYFTEQYTSTKGQFGGDLNWHIKNVVIGSLNQGSRAVIEWNLATDRDFGPRTPGGCSECLGAITVFDRKRFDRNVSYYILAQAAKVIKPGAIRLKVNATQAPLTAFKNSDGSIGIVLLNETEQSSTFVIQSNGRMAPVELPAKAVLSLLIPH